jgi:hypothetical protein
LQGLSLVHIGIFVKIIKTKYLEKNGMNWKAELAKDVNIIKTFLSPEAVFLVVCDHSMNELLAT